MNRDVGERENGMSGQTRVDSENFGLLIFQ
jgi:hypothetical protein